MNKKKKVDCNKISTNRDLGCIGCNWSKFNLLFRSVSAMKKLGEWYKFKNSANNKYDKMAKIYLLEIICSQNVAVFILVMFLSEDGKNQEPGSYIILVSTVTSSVVWWTVSHTVALVIVDEKSLQKGTHKLRRKTRKKIFFYNGTRTQS